MADPSRDEVKIYRHADGLREIRDVWENLQWHPYTDIDYILAELDVDPEIICPYVIALFHEGVPSTLFIGKVVDQPLHIKFGYQTILKVNLRTLVGHHRGILGDAGRQQSEKLIRVLLNVLSKREIELVHIMGLPKSTPLARLADSLPPVAMRDHFPAHGIRWQLRLSETYADFLNEHPSLKRNLRYYANRLQRELGDAGLIRCFAEKKDLDKMMRDLETVASKTWQRGLGAGFVNDLKTRQLLEFFMDRDWLRTYIFYLDEHPVAFNYGIRYGTLFVDEGTGFDPACANFYLGKRLFMKLIEEMHLDEKVEMIDFGPGNDQDKKLFCNQEQEETSVLMFAPTSRCLAVNSVRSLFVLAHQQVKKILKGLNIEGTVKKIWRRHIASQ